MRPVFKPEHFMFDNCAGDAKVLIAQASAEVANAVLDEWLRPAPVVYGDNRGCWGNYVDRDESGIAIDTHKGRVVCIEEFSEEAK